ncbi:hypothetical protein Tco_1062688 [Tanacetum coccineum]
MATHVSRGTRLDRLSLELFDDDSHASGRVFSSAKDGKPITGKTVEKLIQSELFYRLNDKDVVSLYCVGILQFVLLGLEDRPGVPDWILRDANVKRWPSLYDTEPKKDVDKKTYSLFGFTWAIKGGPSSFPTQANNSFFEGAQATPSFSHNMATPNWQTPMLSQMPSHSATPNWQPSILLHLHDAGLLNPFYKKHGDKTKNKVKNANVSPLNLGNAFADDNVGGDDVMFLGEQYIGNYLLYENVDPSKVMREDYIDCIEYLLNPYDF